MAHSNISIFVPHVGCPHTCSFCNQRTITGVEQIPNADDVRETCTRALSEVADYKSTEIAFFGGSFTAIPRDYMLELLNAAFEFVGNDKFGGIRISTRPDCIDEDILALLKAHGVTAIELGAQSMSDKVLKANERGHTSDDVIRASELIKQNGFELGLQMMTGLFQSSSADDIYTMQEIIKLKPKTVRIYPVAVLKGTKLASLYQSGEYKLVSFDEMVKLCVEMLKAFHNAEIDVIRCGLHSSETVEQDIVAGFYHPAFREICISQLFRYAIEKYADKSIKTEVYVSGSSISTAVGHKKANKQYFEENGYIIDFKVDNTLEKDEIRINKDVYNVFEIT
ncbi:MAG: radical SAM protein [Ruminococcus sp.]|nr:radical SAM protein [Ruminococcus sp.]